MADEIEPNTRAADAPGTPSQIEPQPFAGVALPAQISAAAVAAKPAPTLDAVADLEEWFERHVRGTTIAYDTAVHNQLFVAKESLLGILRGLGL